MSEIKFAFEDLKVYDKTLSFIDIVCKVSASFPKTKTYGVSSQFVRAATSVAFNIVEGSGDTDAQFNRFLQIAHTLLRNVLFAQESPNGRITLLLTKKIKSG